MILKYTQR
jgi:hypothetical protein